jgi:beta-1,4-glucosyltransferase
MHTDRPLTDGAFRRIGPLSVCTGSGQSSIEDLLDAGRTTKTTHVAFANTHLLYCAMREGALGRDLEQFYLLNDGIGMSLLSRIATGRGFQENLNGTDFVPRLLDAAPPGARIFLLGGQVGVAQRAALKLQARFPQLVMCGHQHGYANAIEGDVIVSKVKAARPDIVLVALGNPAQENWILHCAERVGKGLFIAVGALFDFLADAQPRAPIFIRKARLEWLFRLMLEPKRLVRRYTFEIGFVTWKIVRQRLSSQTPQQR